MEAFWSEPAKFIWEQKLTLWNVTVTNISTYTLAYLNGSHDIWPAYFECLKIRFSAQIIVCSIICCRFMNNFISWKPHDGTKPVVVGVKKIY